MGWTGIASKLLCQSERVTHKEVMLEQGKVDSSTESCALREVWGQDSDLSLWRNGRGQDRTLCLWRRRLGTDHPASSS